MKQSEAVFTVTMSMLAERGVSFTTGSDNIHNVLTKDITADIRGRVFALFQAGEVALKATEANAMKIQDSKKLASYVGGLVTNWHNRDPRFNGGIKHLAKNPGSRRGQTDESVKEMRKLFKKLEAEGQELKATKVQEAIDSRLAEIEASKPAKTKVVKVDASKLPEALRHLA